LRGQRVLGEADVIAFDSSVSLAVANLARRDAARLMLGATADEAAAQLAGAASRGMAVARLVTGDSVSSPRAAEERALLMARGIAVLTVPGVATVGR
jgi:uroporphyrin-III C-methyltransferase/precorrin-2 dehydrogenase/sirohydrochlorin ferrochelatase